MQMLLNKGSLGDAKIVSDSTFESMLTPVLVHAPGTNPCLHGFMDMSNKGVHIFGHGGDTFWFHTLLAVIPEQDMGIFLSFNSMKGRGLWRGCKPAYKQVFPSSGYPGAIHIAER